jgi:hypothetical protein
MEERCVSDMIILQYIYLITTVMRFFYSIYQIYLTNKNLLYD